MSFTNFGSSLGTVFSIGGPPGPPGPAGPTGPAGPAGPAPTGNSGDMVYLASSGVAGSASNVSYVADGTLTVSNSVTTANLTISNTVFIGNTFWTGTNSTNNVVGAPTRLVFDNTTTPYAANKILLHSNTASANICGFGVVGVYDAVPMTLGYYTSGEHSFTVGANQNFGGYTAFTIRSTGAIDMNGNKRAKLDIGTFGTPSSNTTVRIDGSNVALVTSGSGLVGFGTTAPTANLHVIGNVYASNALVTTNVFATTANVGTLNVWQISNLSSLSLTNNLYAANALTATNVFSNYASISGTANSNVFLFSNLSGGSSVFGMDSNATVVIGIPPSSNVNYGRGYTRNAKAGLVINSGGSATYPINLSLIGSTAQTSSYNNGIDFGGGGQGCIQLVQTSIGAGNGGLSFFFNNSNGNDGNILENHRMTKSAMSINSTAALAGAGWNFQVSGNAYVSNTIQTTNVIAATETLTGTAGQTTSTMTGNLYVSNALTTTNVFATGNTSSISNMVIQAFDFVVASGAGSYSNVCSITDSPNGSAIYVFYVDMMTRATSGNAQTKTYIISSYFNATGGTWTRALPMSNSVLSPQIALDVNTTNGVTTLRATNLGAAVNVNVGIVLKTSSASFTRVSVTDLTSQTGTGATSSGYYPTTQFTQPFGRVGVSIEQPTANLHVVGNVYVSNAVTATTYYGNVVSSNVVVNPATGVTGVNVTGNIYVSNTVTTTNVFAATVSPTNPISFRNRVINGDFLIDQRNSGASSTPSVDPARTIDRWKVNIFGSGRCLVGQNLGGFASPSGFTSYYGMKVTTTTSVGASDYFFLSQTIEGVNMIDWQWGTASARPITLSFWVLSSIAGTAGGFVRNAGSTAGNYTRSYPFTFTITNTLTWEYKTVTIPGDTTGQWLTGQTDGVEFGIELWNGSTYQSAPGAWAAGNFTGPSGGTINYTGTLNSVMNITGVQVELGSVATQFERRLYNFEFDACQRYYETTIVRVGGYNTNGAYFRGSVYFNTKKRTVTPTLTVFSPALETSNVGSLNFDNSNFDGSSARYLVPLTSTGDAYGQWKVSVDCEF